LKTRTILLVEDNEDDVELTLRAFKKNKIANEVVVARDGVEALDYLFRKGSYSDRNTDDMPAVILLDLKLPKLDGMEVLRSIRANENTRLLPVIIMTSSKEEQDIANGYNMGCNSYIRKPVDFIQFTQTVQQLGIYWLLLNELPMAPVAGKKR